MRAPQKVVCVLVGLDFEESLVHPEVFLLYPLTVTLPCFWKSWAYHLLGGRWCVPISWVVSCGWSILCDEEVPSRPAEPAEGLRIFPPGNNNPEPRNPITEELGSWNTLSFDFPYWRIYTCQRSISRKEREGGVRVVICNEEESFCHQEESCGQEHFKSLWKTTPCRPSVFRYCITDRNEC